MTGRVLGSAVRIPPLALLLMAMIALGWGLNWPAMKIALGEIPPFAFRLMCVVLASGALLLVTGLNGGRVAVPLGKLPMLFVISLFSVVGWQMLTAFGLLYIGSGRAAIIAFTMPLWATVLSVAFLGERLSVRQVIALGLGLTALALLIGGKVTAVGEAPLGGLLMTGAALSWATGTILVKKLDWSGIPVTAFSGWQLAIGGIPLLIGWRLVEPLPDPTVWSAEAWFGMLFASLVGMVMCVTGYFKLVTLVPASIAATCTLAVPVVGVVSSALLLAEPIGLAEALALVLVVSGLFLLVRGGERA